MLLFVLQPQFDPRGRAGGDPAREQLAHCCVDMRAIATDVVEGRARDQPALGPGVLVADCSAQSSAPSGAASTSVAARMRSKRRPSDVEPVSGGAAGESAAVTAPGSRFMTAGRARGSVERAELSDRAEGELRAMAGSPAADAVARFSARRRVASRP